jgi:hypothetical protein
MKASLEMNSPGICSNTFIVISATHPFHRQNPYHP